jgi:hypothetical protein
MHFHPQLLADGYVIARPFLGLRVASQSNGLQNQYHSRLIKWAFTHPYLDLDTAHSSLLGHTLVRVELFLKLLWSYVIILLSAEIPRNAPHRMECIHGDGSVPVSLQSLPSTVLSLRALVSGTSRQQG